MPRFENVSISKKANVYFDGKCVSHSVHFPDGTRKSVGVIFPSRLTFTTGERERMEIIAGRCRVQLPGVKDWRVYEAGDTFEVPANSAFDIEPLEVLEYVCHFG